MLNAGLEDFWFTNKNLYKKHFNFVFVKNHPKFETLALRNKNFIKYVE